MKILVFSDIHGRKTVMKRIKEIIEEEKPDHLFLLGDYLYNGPRNGVPSDYDGMGVANMLKTYLPSAFFVRGNCDADVDEMVLGVSLPKRVSTVLDSRRYVLTHGDDTSSAFLSLEENDICLSGHTHIYRLEKVDSIIYVNPGSPSFPKEGNPPTYATILDKKISINLLEDKSSILTLDI